MKLMILIQKFYIFLFIILVFCLGISSSKAEVIDFKNVLKKSIDNSFELKMSHIDIDISKAELKGTRSLYFPELTSKVNTEYNRDVSKNSSAASSVIGSTAFSTTTKFQNLGSLGLSYGLFDFGIRSRKNLIAKKDIDLKKFVYDQELRDLKLKLINLYTESLLVYKDLKAKQDVYPVYKELFVIKEKLYNAGANSRIDIADEAIRIAKTQDEISDLDIKFKGLLKDISFYTQEDYNSDEIELSDFEDENMLDVSNTEYKKDSDNQLYKLEAKRAKLITPIKQLDYTKTPDSKAYDLAIQKKQAELQILKRERLPQFQIYSNYNLYATDKDNMFTSMKIFNNQSVSFGLYGAMTAFDGFKNSADRQKTSLEIKRLEFEKQSKIAELKNKYEKLNEMLLAYDESLYTKRVLLARIQDKLDMIEKLFNQQLINKSDFLSQKADLLVQKIEIEKAIINKISAAKSLEILAENN